MGYRINATLGLRFRHRDGRMPTARATPLRFSHAHERVSAKAQI